MSAQLEVVNAEGLPEFDLLLFRDGRLHETRKVKAKGTRAWVESFQVTEDAEAVRTYAVQLVAPEQPGLRCVNDRAESRVRVFNPRELRVLYIQGALTWDYKFVTLALREDQTIKLTGLARTSKQSVFRQNVESSGELLGGFPTTLEEVAPFRVIVLSNIRPSDLSAAQQQVLARFCGELGGGLLMMGGPNTFDRSWHASRLEQLMPVTFSEAAGPAQQQERAFHLQLSEEALQHPVFQLGDTRATREGWGKLPAFLQYGRVDGAKPGAQVWARHESDSGPSGRRILMASQRYGAGLSAVIAIQNFWRWRLARDSEAQQFDRFWRQLFRFLSDAGRQEISIHLADQELRPATDVRLILEKQRNPGQVGEGKGRYVVRVEGPEKRALAEQSVELEPLRPVEMTFRAENEGTYSASVTEEGKALVATRSIEIRDTNVELERTGRDMEALRQWAAISDGLALRAEECPDGTVLAGQIKAKIDQVQREKQVRRPAGMNGWTLALLLVGLGTEWLLRWRWGMR